MKSTKAAVIQDAPVLFDLEKTLEKVEGLAMEAAKSDPDIILFPEAFIPAYPRGISFGTVVGDRTQQGRETWLRYWKNSLEIPGDATGRLGGIAKKAGALLAIGVVEKGKTGSLYCTLLYFAPNGSLIGKHRKLKPTAAERIIWGEGDGSDLNVHQTEFGKLGGLICWENYMPLARTALYRQGVEIYLAPTADHRDSWQATMRHIACEGRCFVLGCNQILKKSDYPELPGEDLSNYNEIISRGGSVIVDPFGDIIAGPLWDENGILTAVLDPHLIAKAKMDFDAAGHYSRDDVFDFRIRSNH
ncbi:MAG: carbon-nitrogen hydrolase family protein [Balneolaceae bacterium]